MRDRDPQPRLVPGAADRLRRHRARRLAARGRARRRRARGHAVRLRRLADQGRARLHLRGGAERADRPLDSRSCATPSPATRARASSTSINDHSGMPAAALAGRAAHAGPAHRPRPARRRGRAPPTSASQQVAPQVGLISISLNQRRPKPDLPWAANIPNARRPLALPVQAAPRRLPALPRPDEPGQGRAPGDRGRHGARAAAEDGRQEARAEGGAVLRRVRRAAPRRTGSSGWARSRTGRRSSCCRTPARRCSRSSGRSRSGW